MSLSWQHLLAFLVAVGLLVTIHELGHYWVARLLGFKVLRFSVGFGRPLLRRVAGRDRTEYVLAAIPLGGYVKMLDEREAPVDPAEQHRAFNRRPHWQRILVLLAGPGFNIAFAILVLAGLFMANGVTEVKAVVGNVVEGSAAHRGGLREGQQILAIDGRPVAGQRDVQLLLLDRVSAGEPVRVRVSEGGMERTLQLHVEDPAERRRLTEPAQLMAGLGFSFWMPPLPAIVGEVVPGGPGAVAGLQPGDEIIRFDGNPVRDFMALRREIERRPGESVVMTWRRGDQEMTARVRLDADDSQGAPVGRLQVRPEGRLAWPAEMLQHTSLGPIQALSRGTAEAWEMTTLQARVFWRMLMGQVSLKNLSGPLTIAEFAGESAVAGATSFAGFLVLISLSLGFLNLLPIPILDGGQIVYQVVEWAKGSPLSERAQALGQQFGLALLVLLMSVALFNDIARQFG